VLDWTSEAGKRAVFRLATACDLVLTSLPPDQLAAISLSYNSLSAVNPAVGLVSVTNYGLTGPMADFEATSLTAFATGGQMWMTGDPDQPPVKNFGHQAENQAGVQAFAAGLTLLYGSLATGLGDQVDLSIQEAQASLLEVNGPNAFNYGTESFRHGNVLRATWGLYPCRDGYVGIHVLDRNLPQFFHAMGRDDLTDTYLNPAKRAEDNDLLEAIIYSWCGDHTEREIFEAGVSAGAPIAYLPYVDELLTWPGLEEKEFWKVVDHPSAGPLPYPNSAISIGGVEFSIRRAPLLGEHTTEVLREFGFSDIEIDGLRQKEPDSP
jgi:crotonobetainyl-CoA:carnitine CoA-transferase CaiB-like acyl-CoA transferase